MSSKIMRRIISISMVFVMVFALAACSGDKTGEDATNKDVQNETTTKADAEAETTTNVTETETTTNATETETTTGAAEDVSAESDEPVSAIQGIVDIFLSKNFYLSGSIESTMGDPADIAMTCEGDNIKIDIDSEMMDISMYYIDGNPYLVNTSKKQYVLLDEATIKSLESVFSSLSSLGISMGTADMNQMKDMMADFDTSMDFSQYIDDGKFFEYQEEIDGETYFCSTYTTDYGAIFIYTLDGELKFIEIYDTEGTEQMQMNVTMLVPYALTPVSLTGLTKASSIFKLFGL